MEADGADGDSGAQLPPRPLRVAVLGQKDAMLRSLYVLAEARRLRPLEVLVVSPSTAGTVPKSANVEEVCSSLGCQFVVGVKNDIVYEALVCFKPDLLVSILWPRKVTAQMLDLCAEAINFHPSLLPKHRGSLTQFWSIFEGDDEAGSTCHRMVEQFDAGRILHQVAVQVMPSETALSLSFKIAGATEECFRHVLGLFLDNGHLPEGRTWNVGQHPYHFRKLPRDGIIDPGWDDAKVERFIRAMYFPPFAPARAVGPDGCTQDVVDLPSYRRIVDGRLPRRSARFWEDCTTVAPKPAPTTVSGAKMVLRPRITALWPLLVAAMLPLMLLLARHLATPSHTSLGVFDQRRTSSSGPENASRGVRYSVDPTKHPRARCLDGSAVTYYVAEGASTKDRWVIYFQGGGWCSGAKELTDLPGYSPSEEVGHPDMCEHRATGYHGSSRHDEPYRDFASKGFLSGDPKINPMMHDWTRILVRNCDGTLFLGSADFRTVGGGSVLPLRGYDNVLATLQELVENHGLAEATEVVLAGCSAGGAAVVMLADRLRAWLEQRATRPVFVAALADSGIFPEWAASPTSADVLQFPQFEWLYNYANVTLALPSGCVESGHGWRCMLVGTALPYVRTPVFLLQSVVDSWQLSAVRNDALTVLAERLRAESLRSLHVNGVNSIGHGAALDTCFHHCEAWGEIAWGSFTNAEVFQRWYGRRWQSWRRTRGLIEGGSVHEIEHEQEFEGWPLLHAGSTLASPSCFSGHGRHATWHSGLRRFSRRDEL